MTLFDSWVAELRDLRNGQIEATDSLLKLDKWLDLVRVSQLFLAKLLDFLHVL